MSKIDSIHFDTEGLPFPPSLNAYLGHRSAGRIVMAYIKPKAREFQRLFKERLDEVIKETGWDIEQTRDTHYYLDCTMYMPRTNFDENNVYKVLVDCLEDKLIINDKDLVTRTQAVYYDTKNPRVYMHLHPVDYVGVFPNKTEEELFESNCISCTRYLDGRCSILRDSKLGKMRDEIEYELSVSEDGKHTHESISCSKYKTKEKK